MNTMNSQVKVFLLGAVVAVLLLIPVISVLEQPMYDVPSVDPSSDWDFSSGLTLSSSLNNWRANLVSISVSYTEIVGNDNGIGISKPVSFFVKGTTGFGGMLIPDHLPMTYYLNNSMEAYELNVHYTSKLLPGQSKHAIIEPDNKKIIALSSGLTTVLNRDQEFDQIGDQNGYNSKYQEASVPGTGVLTISHLYTDGTDIKITIIDNLVLVVYDHRDLVDFASDNSICICDTPEHMGQTRQVFYISSYESINLTPYIYSVNDAILSLF